MFSDILRRFRGALGNAVVWAATWFVAAFPLTAVFYAFGYYGSQPFWPIVLGTAQSLAGMGFLAGGAFSLYLVVFGRRHSLEDLRPIQSALGSGVTAGLAIPTFALVVNTLGGFSTPIGPSLVVAGVVSVLTGFTSYGQIKVAQHTLSLGRHSPNELGSSADRLFPDFEGEPG